MSANPSSDPVIDFMLDPVVMSLVLADQPWPWSRLSASRVTRIGYKLIVLRCAQLGIDPPTRAEASDWRKL